MLLPIGLNLPQAFNYLLYEKSSLRNLGCQGLDKKFSTNWNYRFILITSANISSAVEIPLALAWKFLWY